MTPCCLHDARGMKPLFRSKAHLCSCMLGLAVMDCSCSSSCSPVLRLQLGHELQGWRQLLGQLLQRLRHAADKSCCSGTKQPQGCHNFQALQQQKHMAYANQGT